MLGEKPLTKEESCIRNNQIRRENLKRIKEGNGEAYQEYLKGQKRRRDRRIARLKSNKEAYQNRLKKQREYGKRYREKIKENDEAYRQYKDKLAEKQRRRMRIYRSTLHEIYSRKLLLAQGFKKSEITEELTQLKKLNVQTIRLVRNNENQKVLEKYVNKNFNLKKGGKNVIKKTNQKQ